MLSHKLHLLGVPLLNVGVVFKESELSLRIDGVLDDIRTLLPELAGIPDIELTHEVKVGEKQLILNVFLVESLQAGFDFNDSKTLLEVKDIILSAIKRLPIKLNSIILDDQSLSSKFSGYSKDKEEGSFKRLMRKRQKSSLIFLLADEDFDLRFPEMAPYFIDPSVRNIEFKIESIHSRYLRIKLIHDGFRKLTKKKQMYLMASRKMQDDGFFNMCTDALRSHKIIVCNAISYINNIDNAILAMEAI